MGQILQSICEVGRAHVVEHCQQRCGALRLRCSDQAGHFGPVELSELAAPAETAGIFAHGHAGQRPFAVAIGLHGDIDERRGPAGLHDGHPAIQQFFEHEDLTWPLLEATQVQRAGAEHHGIWLHRIDASDRQEDAPPQSELGDETDDTGRRAVGPDARDSVPYSTDLVTVGIEHGQAGETGDVDARRRRHDSSLEAVWCKEWRA